MSTQISMENNAFKLLKDIAVIAFLLLFPHFAGFPFYSYSIVCFLLIWFLLRKEGKSFRNIGLTKKGINAKVILIGVASALIWVAFMQLVYIPLIKHLFQVPDYTEYNFIKSSISTFLMVLGAAWLIGGFYEEVVFRGFIQSLLEKRLAWPSGIFWSVVITSLLFGLYHWQQGLFGVIAGILGGLYWGFLNKKFGGNLWIVILSHALFDTIELFLIYIGAFGKL